MRDILVIKVIRMKWFLVLDKSHLCFYIQISSMLMFGVFFVIPVDLKIMDLFVDISF